MQCYDDIRRKILHKYSLLTEQVLPESEFVPRAVIVASLASVIIELICYLIFFGHLYYHNEGLLSRKVLTMDQVRKRRRKNAITFLGQFYGFIVECLLYFGMMYTLKEGSQVIYRLGLVLCFWIEFGIVSIVEVLTSKFLGAHLPHNRFLRYFK